MKISHLKPKQYGLAVTFPKPWQWPEIHAWLAATKQELSWWFATKNGRISAKLRKPEDEFSPTYMRS